MKFTVWSVLSKHFYHEPFMTTIYFFIHPSIYPSFLLFIHSFRQCLDSMCLTLTNRVRGPSCKLREARARTINPSGKKRGSVTYSMDRENEVSIIFIISLDSNREKILIQNNF